MDGPGGQEILAADSRLPLPREVLLRLTFTLNDRAIRDLAGRAVMLHAAGLSHEGRVLTLVAPSGTGKTTAARHLGRLGLGYVTDETVAILRDGTVVPFPKPLAIVDPQRPGLKDQLSPDDLGLPPHDAELRAGPLVLLERCSGTCPEAPVLEQVPLLEGLRQLLPQTSALTALGRPLLTLARLVCSAGGVHRLVYDDIADAGPLLVALAGTARASVPASAVRDDLHPAAGEEVVDAVGLGEETLVLHTGGQHHLGPLASLIWRSFPEHGAAELTELALAALGPHPDAGRIVSETLGSLTDLGLLRRPVSPPG